MNFLVRPRIVSTLMLATGLAAASPLTAQAYWHGGGGCYNCGGGNFAAGALLGLGVGAVVGGAIASQPRYYAPPPVYYAPPPPVYYAPPPPVYYAPPGYYGH